MTVANAERFKQVYQCMDCPPGRKKGHGREVALTGGSTVVKYVEKNLDITRCQGNGKICSPERGFAISGFLFIYNLPLLGLKTKSFVIPSWGGCRYIELLCTGVALFRANKFCQSIGPLLYRSSTVEIIIMAFST